MQTAYPSPFIPKRVQGGAVKKREEAPEPRDHVDRRFESTAGLAILAERRSGFCGWGPGASCGRITLWGYSAVSSSRLLAGGDGGAKTVPPGAHLELVLDVVAVAVCSTPRASDGDPPRVRRRHPTNST